VIVLSVSPVVKKFFFAPFTVKSFFQDSLFSPPTAALPHALYG
jgi:hypothetical protein